MQNVRALLESLGLASLADTFAQNHIDSETLPGLSDADLKELGVSSLGHRRRILAAAQSMGLLPGVSLDQLPSHLAIPLQRWAEETHPVQRLWRISDSVEVLLRYLFAIALSDLMRRHGGELPGDLRRRLGARIQAPTFGTWMSLLRDTFEAHDGAAPIPSLAITAHAREAFSGAIGPLVGAGDDGLGTHLLPLRNLLAHGGGISSHVGREYLTTHGHEARVTRMLRRQGAWLGSHLVVHVEHPGVCWQLRGLQDRPSQFEPASPDVRKALDVLPGAVTVVSPDGSVLDLSPILSIGIPAMHRAGSPLFRGPRTSPQVFVRASRTALLYNALSGDLPLSEDRGDKLERFRALFAVGARRVAGAEPTEAACDFADEMEGEAAAMVGRTQELRLLVERLVGSQKGLFWLFGSPGSGKSTLLAAAACHRKLASDPRKALVIFHRFKSGDARCSLASFLRNTLSRLESWAPLVAGGHNGGLGNVDDDEDTPSLMRHLGESLQDVERLAAASNDPRARPPRVIFILDGLDEIARLDPRILELLPTLQRRNVCCLCAGRPETSLQRLFHETLDAESVYPAGLPGMSDGDVREMLLQETHSARYAILALDTDAGPGATNVFVDFVVQSAAGLPLFVYLVLQDLLQGHFRPDRAEKIPRTVALYYENLLSRYAVDDLHQVLTPLVSMIAVSAEALDADALHALLVRRTLAEEGAAGRELTVRALQTAGPMLRGVPTPEGRQGYTMYHDTFREHVTAQSVLTRQSVATAKRVLADAARNWDAPALSPVRGYLLRNGASHLLESELWDAAEQLLTSRRFHEARVADGKIHHLVEDLARASLALPSGRAQAAALALLAEAVQRESQFVHSHRGDYPQGLFQCVWNLCWWYGHDELGAHYDSASTPSDSGPGRVLRSMLEQWRSELGSESLWLRSLRPPRIALGGGLITRFAGAAEDIECLAFSPDGKEVASVYGDSVSVWATASGVERLRLQARALRRDEGKPLESPLEVAFSEDAARLVCWAGEEVSGLWSLRTGEPLVPDELAGRASGPGGWQTHRGFVWPSITSSSPDGELSIVIRDRSIDLIRGGELRLHTLQGHTGEVLGAGFLPGGQSVVSCSWDETVRIWDVVTGNERYCLRGHKSPVAWVGCLADGEHLLSASIAGGKFLWDLATGSRTAELSDDLHERLFSGYPPSHALSAMQGVAYSAQQGLLAAATSDGNVRIWRLDGIRQAGEQRGDGLIRPIILGVTTPEGGAIVTGSLHGFVDVWNVRTGVARLTIRVSEKEIGGLEVSSCGRLLYSRARYSETTETWDILTGEMLRSQPGRFTPPPQAVETGPLSMEKRGTDTAILLAGASVPVAWWPGRLSGVVLQDERAFGGIPFPLSEVVLLRLEGATSIRPSPSEVPA
jgi:WD40 repeat protein